MSITSTFKKSRPYRAFWSAFLGIFMVFGLFSGWGFSVKTAQGANNYISNISFYQSGNNLYTQFFVNTSFDLSDNWSWGYGGTLFTTQSGYLGSVKPTICDFEANTSPAPTNCGTNGFCHFTAGYTYTINLNGVYHYTGGGGCWTLAWYESIFGAPVASHYVFYQLPPISDTQPTYFTEKPTMTITYPQDNYEIANLFTIQGSFTQPAENPSGFLQVDSMPAGTFSSSLQSFWQSIQSATSGSVLIEVGNLPAGYYDFRIYFRSGGFDFFQGALISNIHIVNDLPQFIPSWASYPSSTAPIVYNPHNPHTFYGENSSYETSTKMYDTLTDTFAPVLLTLGQNLTDFATRFSQSNASSTGNQLGSSIVIVRSYTQNINEFFNGFPLSQILLLYLVALVVVIILRLVKGLINLFKL